MGAGAKFSRILANASERAFPLALLDCYLLNFLRLARRDLFRSMQNGRVRFTKDFVSGVTVDSVRAFIPKLDVALEVFPNNGILGRRFQDALNEVQRLVGVTDDSRVE